MVLGMSLLLWALGHGDTGVTTILSATTPVILLPLLWIRLRQAPTFGAWVGALLTVAGTALLLALPARLWLPSPALWCALLWLGAHAWLAWRLRLGWG